MLVFHFDKHPIYVLWNVNIANGYSLVWLQVSVDDAIAMYVLQCQYCLRKIHGCQVNGKAADILQESTNVPTLHIFHHHIQVALRGRRCVRNEYAVLKRVTITALTLFVIYLRSPLNMRHLNKIHLFVYIHVCV